MKEILCFGDSLTYGFGLRREDTWIQFLKNKGYQVKNFGVNGDVVPNIVRRMKSSEDVGEGTMVFLMGGTNDFLMGYRSVDIFRDLKDGVNYIFSKGGIPLIGIPMLPTFCEEPSGYMLEQSICRQMEGYRKDCYELAKRTGAYIIDFQFEMGKLKDFPELFFDEVHPNVRGAQVMGEIFYNFLKNI